MTTELTDVIDDSLGATPDSFIAQLRGERAEQRRLTAASYRAALTPEQPRNFSPALRAALACRMAALWGCKELVAHYRQALAAAGPSAELAAAADPAAEAHSDDARLTQILRHVDLVTRHPKQASEASIAQLFAAGLDDRDIVTLAGLIAFVNYQILIVAGLASLRDN